MDKQDVINILNECFSNEGYCALLHLTDGSDLLLNNKPSFTNFLINVQVEINFNENIVHEMVYIPYSSVLYIMITSMDDLNIILSEGMDV